MVGDSFDEVIHNVAGIKGEQPGIYLITSPDFAGSIPGEMAQVTSLYLSKLAEHAEFLSP